MSHKTQSAESDPAVTEESQLEFTQTVTDAALQAPDSPSEQATQQLTGYELVEDMMRRQDAVIAELDSLNKRIESAIEGISAARKLEQDEQAHDQLDAEADQSEPMPLKQAA